MRTYPALRGAKRGRSSSISAGAPTTLPGHVRRPISPIWRFEQAPELTDPRQVYVHGARCGRRTARITERGTRQANEIGAEESDALSSAWYLAARWASAAQASLRSVRATFASS